MRCFTIVCLAAIAAVALSNDIRIKTDVFTQSSNPYFKVLPKDFRQLENEVSQESPLILFIRNGKGIHDRQQYLTTMQKIKQTTLDKVAGNLSNDDRFSYFDPELDDEGNKQAQYLKEQLKTSGWMHFLDRVEDVQYISSPMSRSIETALQAIPDCKIILDDGVRPQITQIGVDLRRNFESPLTLGDETLESAQTKFKAYKERLIFQMANHHSENVYEKFGYLSDEDPAVKNPRQESNEELDARIGKWLNMLRPRSKEEKSTVTHVMDKIMPNPIQQKMNKLPPKVYVVFTNASFINGVIKRFDLDMYQKEELNYCEVVPLLLQFGSGSSGTASKNY